MTDEKSDFIFRAVSTYSPSGQESGFAKAIMEYFQSKHLSPRLDSVGNVLCEFGSGNKTVLLCGHMDTVPGVLPVRMENGRVFGRGACDAKGPLISLLFAFDNLASELQGQSVGRIVFAGVTEEERSSSGLAEIIRSNLKADYAFFGEPGGLSRITVGYRGHLTLRLTIITPEIHASAPKFVINSAELLYDVYSTLKKVLVVTETGSLEQFSVALTEISSGTAHNVIPGKTSATIDIRVPIGSQTSQARTAVESVISDFGLRLPSAQISAAFDEPTEPYRVPLNSPLVRALSRSILRKGSKPQFITKSGTGDMNTYAQTFGVDSVTYGPGEAVLSHSSEENVSVEEILSCADILTNSIMELMLRN